MKRLLASIAVVMVCAIGFAGAPASAQDQGSGCFPGSGPDYPPTTAGVSLEADLVLITGQIQVRTAVQPGAVSELIIDGAQPGLVYCGNIFSTPVVVPETRASATGRLTFQAAIPADFELNAAHHLDVYRSGQLAGAFDFCVTKTGQITGLKSCGKTAVARGGPLAKTGADHVLDVARIAAVLLAVGVTLLYVQRRRRGAASA